MKSLRPLGWAVVLTSILWLGWSSSASADSNTKALDYVQQNMLHVKLGWMGIALSRGGETVHTGLFGLGIDRFFQESSEATELLGTYRGLRIGGFVMFVVGMAALIIELVLIFVSPNLIRGNVAGLSPLFWGLTIGGSLISLAGGFMTTASQTFLSRAVAAYNRDLFNRAKTRKWSLHFRVLPEGGMLAMGYKF